MPCRDGGPCEEDIARDAQRERKKQQDKLDKVTRLLCETLTVIEQCADDLGPSVVKSLVSKECAVWWNEHQAADKRRIAAEEKAVREEKKRLLDRAEMLKKDLQKTLDQLDKHK